MKFKFWIMVSIICGASGAQAGFFDSIKTSDSNFKASTPGRTASNLLSRCRTPSNDFDKGICYGKIAGFLEGMNMSDALRQAPPEKRIFCAEADKVSGNPVGAIAFFLDWMDVNQDKWDWDYNFALVAAFEKGFPCKVRDISIPKK